MPEPNIALISIAEEFTVTSHGYPFSSTFFSICCLISAFVRSVSSSSKRYIEIASFPAPDIDDMTPPPPDTAPIVSIPSISFIHSIISVDTSRSCSSDTVSSSGAATVSVICGLSISGINAVPLETERTAKTISSANEAIKTIAFLCSRTESILAYTFCTFPITPSFDFLVFFSIPCDIAGTSVRLTIRLASSE